mmetsp:Transcript_23190/g.38382  ORF Transcript_23190/g.38382 Transcript_23190/m.38382 type:complete len:277 (-) Transcript_23190:1262-2092(-)
MTPSCRNVLTTRPTRLSATLSVMVQTATCLVVERPPLLTTWLLPTSRLLNPPSTTQALMMVAVITSLSLTVTLQTSLLSSPLLLEVSSVLDAFLVLTEPAKVKLVTQQNSPSSVLPTMPVSTLKVSRKLILLSMKFLSAPNTSSCLLSTNHKILMVKTWKESTLSTSRVPLTACSTFATPRPRLETSTKPNQSERPTGLNRSPPSLPTVFVSWPFAVRPLTSPISPLKISLVKSLLMDVPRRDGLQWLVSVPFKILHAQSALMPFPRRTVPEFALP